MHEKYSLTCSQFYLMIMYMYTSRVRERVFNTFLTAGSDHYTLNDNSFLLYLLNLIQMDGCLQKLCFSPTYTSVSNLYSLQTCAVDHAKHL